MESTLEVLTTRKFGCEPHRYWPDDVKAQIVSESFRPGALVNEVAWRHFSRRSEEANPEQFDLVLEDLEAAIAAVHAEDEPTALRVNRVPNHAGWASQQKERGRGALLTPAGRERISRTCIWLLKTGEALPGDIDQQVRALA